MVFVLNEMSHSNIQIIRHSSLMSAVEGITEVCIGFLEGEEFEVGLCEEESGVCVF